MRRKNSFVFQNVAFTVEAKESWSQKNLAQSDKK